MAPGSSEDQSHYRTNADGRHTQLEPAAWMQVTEIDDDDLQFGGKSLSEWYEEERRRLSHGSASSSDEEEQRGRQRVRKHQSTHHRHRHDKQQNMAAGKS